MAEQALAGLRVIEWGNYISAPYCAKLLADLGAEVIKIEEPGWGDIARRHGPFPGDVPHPEKSGLFLYLNTNKLGITLNLRTFTGQKILKELLKEADVFVENNPPRLMEELGLDYEHLKELYPRLIMTSITPYGQTGPYRDYRGYDINVCAAAAISFSVGERGREPLIPPLGQSEYQAAMGGAAATMVALLAREVTGRGQHVDATGLEIFATIHSGGTVTTYLYQGITGYREGHRRADLYPYAVLPCKDGYICLIAREGRQWKRFLEVMGNPAWSKDPRFWDRRAMAEQYADEVDSYILPWLKERTKEEIFALCRQNRIPFAPVRTIDEVVKEPHLEQRGFFVEIEHPQAGALKYPGVPYRFSATPCQVWRPAPLLGEHNEEIYCRRLGYTREELADLRRGGII